MGVDAPPGRQVRLILPRLPLPTGLPLGTGCVRRWLRRAWRIAPLDVRVQDQDAVREVFAIKQLSKRVVGAARASHGSASCTVAVGGCQT